MSNRIITRRLIPAGLLVLGSAACGGTESAPAPADRATEGMPPDRGPAAMQVDSAMLRRHMQEEDALMVRMRADLEQMRRLPSEQWPAHMPEHLAVMDSMFAMMQMQPRMSVDGGMPHHRMGAEMHQRMMGGEMHARMMGEMQALRADADALRSASPAEMQQRMPAHLDRYERMLQMMEQMHGGRPGM